MCHHSFPAYYCVVPMHNRYYDCISYTMPTCGVCRLFPEGLMVIAECIHDTLQVGMHGVTDGNHNAQRYV